MQKTHVTQLKFPAPAAMETWVVGLPRRADPAGRPMSATGCGSPCPANAVLSRCGCAHLDPAADLRLPWQRPALKAGHERTGTG